MVDSRRFYEVVSGQRRGVLAGMVRALLAAAEIPYTWVVQARNRAYDRGTLRTHWVGVPVISVGNLVLGGTGKTPLVAWLAGWFRDRGIKVAILSRGYGAVGKTGNDEAKELRCLLPDVPHFQNPDRVGAARQAINELKAEVLILDDGFQHRRLHRDLDIVLLNALEPFGFGHVFPRGTLREPLSELRRAHVVVLSHAKFIDPAFRAKIRSTVQQLAPEAEWAEVVYEPQGLVSASGEIQSIALYRRQNVAAFCGIGNPAAFRLTLEECGFRVIAFQEFPDHHFYRAEELRRLADWANRLDVSAVICTPKDLVKIASNYLGERPLWALQTKVAFVLGEEALEKRLVALCPENERNRPARGT